MAPTEPRAFVVAPEPRLRGETAGDGPPVVLCHGITATRRYVLHGSSALPRAGYAVTTYDARGHGESDPAPVGEGYGYPELVADLERVVEARLGDERFVLGGHSMGAHTAAAYALRHPERLAGLVLIGPTYLGRIEETSIVYWEGLAAALEQGGVEAFVEYLSAEGGTDPAWRSSVLRFTRERMLLQRNPGALAQALRETTRSRPFESLEELRSLDLPALVVASRDEADPGHPFAAAEAYAKALPQGRLVSEGEGESPLAWQGGRLSRAIAAFCGEAGVLQSKALSS
jgi:pimeloyl-ACP methyl ester carboxylesterase